MRLNIILSLLVVFFAAVFGVSSAFAAEESKALTGDVAATIAVPSQSEQLKSEDQIPLKIDAAGKTRESSSATTKLVMTLIVVAGLAGGLTLVVKKYSYNSKTTKAQTQIKVLSQHFLGPKKSLAIIRVAGESILVGITDHNISMIKSLSLLDDEIPAETPMSFSQQLTEAREPSATLAATVDLQGQIESEDDFSFAGLKSTVSQKLKTMRNI